MKTKKESPAAQNRAVQTAARRRVALALMAMVLAAHPIKAAVIYSDDFSGEGTANLNGTLPDVSTNGAAWQASTIFKANGTVTPTTAGGGAYLPFTPTAGNAYTLTGDLMIEDVENNNWIALGFVQSTGTLNGDAARHPNNANGIAWVFLRKSAANPNQNFFGGPKTANNLWTGELEVTTLNVQITLDASDENHVLLSLNVNGGTQEVAQANVGPLAGLNINGVGFSFDSGGNGSFGNFTLSVGDTGVPVLLNIVQTATDFNLSWNSQADRLYNILTSDGLTVPPAQWTVFQSNILATPPVNGRNVPAAGARQFYVVEESRHPVRNAGFEADALAEGTRTNTPTAWNQGYYNLLAPTVWVEGESGGGAYNPDATQGYGGVAPEGQNVLYATARIGFDDGLSQVLATKVQTNRQYDLSVLVGNPYLYNNNSLTANYRIELLAGGVVLASATGPSPMDDSAWTNVMVTYHSGASPAQLGQGLEIRLLAQDDFDGLQVDFDEVLLTVTPVEPTPVFSEDFENGASGWTQGSDGGAGTAWELGVPETVGPAAAHSPTNCYGTNLRGDYGLNANVWLRSPAIDLTTAPSATLRFWQYIDIEPQFDFGSVRILDASNDSELAVIEARVEGRNIDWAEYSTALPPTALGKQIKVEFRLQSDNLDSYVGWYLDDVAVLVP